MPADDILQLVTILIILVLVMAAAYFVTRFLGRYAQGAHGGNNIEVIETYRLSPSMYTQILRLGKTYVAVAVCKDTVTKLAELQEDEIERISSSPAEGSSFKDVLALWKQKGAGVPSKEKGQE